MYSYSLLFFYKLFDPIAFLNVQVWVFDEKKKYICIAFFFSGFLSPLFSFFFFLFFYYFFFGFLPFSISSLAFLLFFFFFFFSSSLSIIKFIYSLHLPIIPPPS